MKVTISKTTITVDGKRAGVTYAKGPWVPGACDPGTIKVYPKRYSFPAAFRAAFTVENKSDPTTDYFEKDVLRLVPGHPLYELVHKAAWS